MSRKLRIMVTTPRILRALETNRRNWNERAAVHHRDENGFYRIGEFKNGADVLGPIETAELGDVAGLDILHLQCHIGLDTLSLARRGANVTGLDFSENAVEIAGALASETQLKADFVQGNVHQIREIFKSTFDVVYATWGVFCWVPDAKIWIANAAALLKSGGKLYIADDHPVGGMLDETSDGELQVDQNYRTTPEQFETYQTDYTYTGAQTKLKNTTCHEWIHPIDEFINGVIEADLRLLFFREHDELPWQRYRSLVKNENNNMWRFPDNRPKIPLSFSLMAEKK